MPIAFDPWSPLVRWLGLLEPERAHWLTIQALKLGFVPRAAKPDPILGQTLWNNRHFATPIGLAAGFDKNAEAFRPMLRLGLAAVEVGTITPKPQAGNPRPRIFRLPEDRALINRLGFNNDGLDAAARRLVGRDPRWGVVGANVGKNRDSEDAVADYVAGVRQLAPLADYLTVNISSPNTPGLRQLQMREPLARLIDAVKDARDRLSLSQPPPIVLKVAPDLDQAMRADIAELALARGIDGLIVANTTVARPPALASRHRGEAGGLSGRPLFQPSTEMLADFRRLTQGRLLLVGVGGIASGRDAYLKIRAGASLVQLYTALVYDGPGLIQRMENELAQCLRADGFVRLGDAVGAGLPSLE
jgi:dihydroorotate dehydrogenase